MVASVPFTLIVNVLPDALDRDLVGLAAGNRERQRGGVSGHDVPAAVLQEHDVVRRRG